MLESLLLIFFTSIGILFLIVSVIFLTISIFKDSKKLRKIGLRTGLVTLISFGIMIFWYSVIKPLFNKSQMNQYSGIYLVSTDSISTNNSNELHLFKNGSYSYDGNEKFIQKARIEAKGYWKTGGIDGLFEFRNSNNHLTNWASPYGGGLSKKYIVFSSYEGNEIKFIKKNKK